MSNLNLSHAFLYVLDQDEGVARLPLRVIRLRQAKLDRQAMRRHGEEAAKLRLRLGVSPSLKEGLPQVQPERLVLGRQTRGLPQGFDVGVRVHGGASGMGCGPFLSIGSGASVRP